MEIGEVRDWSWDIATPSNSWKPNDILPLIKTFTKTYIKTKEIDGMLCVLFLLEAKGQVGYFIVNYIIYP